jgi:hypothetical protein
MNIRHLIFASCAMLALNVGTTLAGPCDTAGKAAQMRDAGSGPTPGHTDQTTSTDSAANKEHPPTSAMNRAAAGGATSSQDVQKQTQGQPTAAQEAQGAKPSGTSDQGC